MQSQEQRESRKKAPRPGESKVVYLDGTRTRYLNGRITERTDWGIKVERDDGDYEISWKAIKSISPPRDETEGLPSDESVNTSD